MMTFVTCCMARYIGIGNVKVGASSIDSLETVHDEFFLEIDDHFSLEDDLWGLYLNHIMI